MAGECPKDRYLTETPTWAVAIVCFVIVAVSIVIEHIIHIIEHWLTKKHKVALYEALEKVKAELMLLGFISLLLTILQDYISQICIPERVANTWHPCTKDDKKLNAKKSLTLEESLAGRRHLSDFDSYESLRRILAAATPAKCGTGKVPLVSAYGIHQLHIFIFVLACFHILYCITTLSLSRAKMKRWQLWEKETRTVEYEFSHDPERFRFTRETTFGRRHLSFWSKSPVLLWIVCFFRQFTGAVKKVDYLTLRHGFIMAHLAPQSGTRFDFQKYIQRSLDEDFKVVVGISPVIWFFAVLLLLANTRGWFSYLWLPFIPLILILLVSTKLQVIITKMGLRIQDRGDVVKGDLTVEPADDLFWFDRPRLVLSLIHFILFQNAFQLAFFAWSTYEFGLRSCFHERIEDILIRISIGILVQFICSYVTLPLYALVTQMGSNMRPTIFNERVAGALRKWHHTARNHVKHNQQSKGGTPNSSMPSTPLRGMSPVHLLSNYQGQSASAPVSPRTASHWEYNEHWESEGSPSPSHLHGIEEQDRHAIEMGLTRISMPPPSQDNNGQEHEPGTSSRDEHNIHMGPASKDFSFDKRSRV